MLSVGTILKKEREKKGLLLIDIEKQIKVREKYLKAIEEEDWNFFSSRIYIIGILKNYSRVLSLDEKKILAFFRRDYEKKEEVKFKRKITSAYLTSETKKFLKLGLVILSVFFIGYFIYQLKIYFSPPSFTFLTPKVKNFTIEKSVKISGKTDKDTMITIAGERIYQNKEGVFIYDYSLNEGNNKLIINLTGANGKKTTIEKTFFKKTPQ
ncbi:MAG: helix-turn-helix domain-containing protein [Candidatus Roizmanbacteria bacterium]|nr:helix-turn-helix domain-containing protein [Candidatus Roizmanbacteria bacterium]